MTGRYKVSMTINMYVDDADGPEDAEYMAYDCLESRWDTIYDNIRTKFTVIGVEECE